MVKLLLSILHQLIVFRIVYPVKILKKSYNISDDDSGIIRLEFMLSLSSLITEGLSSMFTYLLTPSMDTSLYLSTVHLDIGQKGSVGDEFLEDLVLLHCPCLVYDLVFYPVSLVSMDGCLVVFRE